jgi:hypothetical protein
MTLVEKIKSRGYWRVMIRPGRFVEKRIGEISTLFPIIQKASVEFRGWDFPHVDTRTNPRIDVDWVGQQFEWEQYLEIWRFYQSGQFVDVVGIPSDWRDQSKLWPADEGWSPGSLLGIGEVLFRFIEIFEFAARLSLTEAGDESITIQIIVGGLAGRKLFVDIPNRWPMFKEYKASLSEFPYTIELSRTELVAQPRELSLKPTAELFARFGWIPDAAALRDIQKSLWKS